ncbi:MAG: tRNA (adenosine(37)-N6)-threonylcarbamoyltransferase complex dimerization subunit type 1 TsaB [Alphaproteobacteria bacterium]|nr:tRNA (adenosine(37)-N6)-threonylcarbamoyltransferase complex dimerization subunit type 1 TsaB [Alphaproteobacteria bacterium]
MNLLAFETSIGNCSVALFHKDKKHFAMSDNKLMQSEELLPMVNAMLEEHGMTYQDLDGVSCTIGPGSFTGIRVGIAAAKGIKKVLPNIRLIGVSTLDIMVHDIANTFIKCQKILAVLKAYGDEFYTQEFSSDKISSSEIKLMSKEKLEKETNKYEMIVSNETHGLNCHSIDITALSVLNKAEKIFASIPNQNDISPLYVKDPSIHRKT